MAATTEELPPLFTLNPETLWQETLHSMSARRGSRKFSTRKSSVPKMRSQSPEQFLEKHGWITESIDTDTFDPDTTGHDLIEPIHAMESHSSSDVDSCTSIVSKGEGPRLNLDHSFPRSPSALTLDVSAVQLACTSWCSVLGYQSSTVTLDDSLSGKCRETPSPVLLDAPGGISLLGGILDGGGRTAAYVHQPDREGQLQKGDLVAFWNGHDLTKMSFEEILRFCSSQSSLPCPPPPCTCSIVRSSHRQELYDELTYTVNSEVDKFQSKEVTKVSRDPQEDFPSKRLRKDTVKSIYLDDGCHGNDSDKKYQTLWKPSLSRLNSDWINQNGCILISLRYEKTQGLLFVEVWNAVLDLPNPTTSTATSSTKNPTTSTSNSSSNNSSSSCTTAGGGGGASHLSAPNKVKTSVSQAMVNIDLHPRPSSSSAPASFSAENQASRLANVMSTGEIVWSHSYPGCDMTVDEVVHTDLSVTVWESVNDEYRFVGELQLLLSDTTLVDLSGQPLWYPLGEHNPNLGPLPEPIAPPSKTRAIINKFHSRMRTTLRVVKEGFAEKDSKGGGGFLERRDAFVGKSTNTNGIHSSHESLLSNSIANGSRTRRRKGGRVASVPNIAEDSSIDEPPTPERSISVSSEQEMSRISPDILINPEPAKRPKGGVNLFKAGSSHRTSIGDSVCSSFSETDSVFNESNAMEIMFESGCLDDENGVSPFGDSHNYRDDGNSSLGTEYRDSGRDSPQLGYSFSGRGHANGTRVRRAASVGDLLANEATARVNVPLTKFSTLGNHSSHSLEDLTEDRMLSAAGKAEGRGGGRGLMNKIKKRLSRLSSEPGVLEKGSEAFSIGSFGYGQFLPSSQQDLGPGRTLSIHSRAYLSLLYTDRSKTLRVIFGDIVRLDGRSFTGDCLVKIAGYHSGQNSVLSKRQIPLKYSPSFTGLKVAYVHTGEGQVLRLQFLLSNGKLSRSTSTELWLDVEVFTTQQEVADWYPMPKC